MSRYIHFKQKLEVVGKPIREYLHLGAACMHTHTCTDQSKVENIPPQPMGQAAKAYENMMLSLSEQNELFHS